MLELRAWVESVPTGATKITELHDDYAQDSGGVWLPFFLAVAHSRWCGVVRNRVDVKDLSSLRADSAPGHDRICPVSRRSATSKLVRGKLVRGSEPTAIASRAGAARKGPAGADTSFSFTRQVLGLRSRVEYGVPTIGYAHTPRTVGARRAAGPQCESQS